MKVRMRKSRKKIREEKLETAIKKQQTATTTTKAGSPLRPRPWVVWPVSKRGSVIRLGLQNK